MLRNAAVAAALLLPAILATGAVADERRLLGRLDCEIVSAKTSNRLPQAAVACTYARADGVEVALSGRILAEGEGLAVSPGARIAWDVLGPRGGIAGAADIAVSYIRGSEAVNLGDGATARVLLDTGDQDLRLRPAEMLGIASEGDGAAIQMVRLEAAVPE